MSLIAYFLWILSVLIFLLVISSEYQNGGQYSFGGWVHPIVLIVIYLLWLFCPFNILWRGSRWWFLCSLGRLIVTPLYDVQFRDFWLADQLTSLGDFLFQLQFVLCIYPTQLWKPGMNYIMNFIFFN